MGGMQGVALGIWIAIVEVSGAEVGGPVRTA